MRVTGVEIANEDLCALGAPVWKSAAGTRRIGATLPGAAWQPCRTHYATNLMAVTPKSSWPWVRTLLHSVYDQPDAQSVAAQYDRIIDALSDELPKVADHLEDARADLPAFTAFPKQHHGVAHVRTYPTIAPAAQAKLLTPIFHEALVR